jgi:hypothetical protein
MSQAWWDYSLDSNNKYCQNKRQRKISLKHSTLIRYVWFSLSSSYSFILKFLMDHHIWDFFLYYRGRHWKGIQTPASVLLRIVNFELYSQTRQTGLFHSGLFHSGLFHSGLLRKGQLRGALAIKNCQFWAL